MKGLPASMEGLYNDLLEIFFKFFCDYPFSGEGRHGGVVDNVKLTPKSVSF